MAISRDEAMPAGIRGSLPLSDRILLLDGWPRRLFAFVAGACGVLAMAPLGIFPAMALSLISAVWLIDGAARTSVGRDGRRRDLRPTLLSAFGTGWWWGFGYFTAGLYWLGSAFLVAPAEYAWALPLGVVGLPAVLGIYTGLAFAVARALWVPGAGRIVVLALALLGCEWLRGVLFTGFPWNDLGMTLGTDLVLAQVASVVGLHGLTALTVLIFAAPATLADRPDGRRSLAPTILACAAFLALAGFGALRLETGHVGTVPGVKLRIMQPDVFGDAAFSYDNRKTLLATYLALSDRATSQDTGGLADVTHLIWPESPFPFILARDPDALDAIAAALPKDGVLITGAARVEGSQGDPADPLRYFNSIQVVGKDGSVGATYDKVHLVPFGEYVPYESLLGRLGISQFVPLPGGFTPGGRPHLLHVPGLPPIVPVVCYEASFTGEILPPGDEDLGAGAILNVSDDGWFGQTAGPYQHLAQARLRAIEQGLPLLRAANTGISAIIDPYGRILQELPLGRAAVIDGFLPKSVAPTIFAEYNQTIQWVTLGLLLTVIFLMRYGVGRHRSGSRHASQEHRL